MSGDFSVGFGMSSVMWFGFCYWFSLWQYRQGFKDACEKFREVLDKRMEEIEESGKVDLNIDWWGDDGQ